MARMGVQVVLEAEDRARAVLDQFGRTVIDLSDRAERGLARIETALSRTGRATRALAIPLVSELAPAFDTATARMASVITTGASLGRGLTSLGFVAAGLAGVVGGELVRAWRESTRGAEEFRQALESTDPGRLAAKVADLRRELTALADQRDRLNRLQREGIGEGLLVPDLTEGRRQQIERDLSLAARLREIREREAAIRAEHEAFPAVEQQTFELRLREAERRREEQVREAQRIATERARLLREAEQARFSVSALDLADTGLREGGLVDEQAMARAQAAVRAADERAARAEAEVATERARLLREAEQARFSVSALDLADTGLREGGLVDEQARARAEAAVRAADERAARAEAEAFRLRAVAGAAGLEAEGLVGPEAIERGRRAIEEADRRERDRIEAAQELLDIEQRRLAILQLTPGLTQSERDALTDSLDSARELVRLEEARLELLKARTPEEQAVAQAQRDQIQLEEAMIRAIRTRERLERDVGVVGLERGISDVADEWAAQGRRMESIAQRTALNIQGAFAQALRGDLIGRDFARAMFVTLTDELAKLITGNLFGLLRGVLRPLAEPGGAAGAALQTVGATLDVTGAPSSQLVALQSAGYDLVATGSGRTIAVPATGPQILGTPLYYRSAPPPASAQTSGAVAMQRFGEIRTEQIQAGVDYPVYTGFGGAVARGGEQPGLTAEGLLRGAAGAIAFGVALHGAYRAGQSDDPLNIGLAAASAVTTGVIAFGAAGAAAGALGGVLLAGLGAEAAQAKRRRQRRRENRLRVAQGVLRQLSDNLNRRLTIGVSVAEVLALPVVWDPTFGEIEDEALRRRYPPTVRFTTGGLLLSMANHVGGPPELVALLQEHGIRPEEFTGGRVFGREGSVDNTAELVKYAGGQEAVRNFLDAAYNALLRVQRMEERAQELRELESVAYDEAAGGVTRRTYLPVASLDEYLGARARLGRLPQVEYSSQLLTRRGLTDEERAWLVDQIRRYIVERDIDLTERHFLRLE